MSPARSSNLCETISASAGDSFRVGMNVCVQRMGAEPTEGRRRELGKIVCRQSPAVRGHWGFACGVRLDCRRAHSTKENTAASRTEGAASPFQNDNKIVTN